MDFSYDFIIDIMANFYDFFFGWSKLLTYSIQDIELQFNLIYPGETLPRGVFVWSWYNPFSNIEVSRTIENSFVLEGFMKLIENVPSVTRLMPLWQVILISIVELFLLFIILKVVFSLIDSIT